MIQLLHGDCLDVLPTLADGSIDVVITDPPYSETTHQGARTAIDTPLITTFSSITTETFLVMCRECIRVARRWVVMTCDWHHATIAEYSGLPVVRLGVWVKPNAAPQFTGDRPGTGWEAVLMLHREGKKRWNGGGHHAVWMTLKENGEHPTQKPLPLIRQWVQQFSDPGETILDPYMGSGTTGIACLDTGRSFIGIEIDPAYYDLASRRIAAHTKRMAESPELTFA